MRHVSAAAFVLAFLALAACNSPPRNRGTSGYRIDPTSDSPAELGSRDLRSADLLAATDAMAQSIAARLDVTNRASPPRIVVGQIENRTSMPEQNYQVFLVRLRAVLMDSSSRHGLAFIREKPFVQSERAREHGDASAGQYVSAADFVLTCEVYDLPTAGTNYFLLDYQLVQLREAASGPDTGAGAIIWENKYEVKFQ
jgi:hypothetical protein